MARHPDPSPVQRDDDRPAARDAADGDAPDPSPGPARPRAGLRRGLGLGLGVVGLLLLAETAAVAVSGVQAGLALQRVADSAPELVADLRERRFDEAGPLAESMRDDARAAARATSQWPYRLAEQVPWVGDQLRAVGAAATASALLAEPLPDLVPAAEEVLSGDIVSADQRVDVDSVRRLVPLVQDLSRRTDAATAELQAARSDSLVEPLSSRLDPAAELLAEAAPALRTAAQVLPQVPAMLGDPQPRTYLVAFTNPTEIRTTQGMVGAYAVVRLTGGQVSLERTGTDEDLTGVRADPSVLGPEFTALYGDKPARVQNLTMGAEAADAGRLTADLWVAAGGERPDAVVLLSPVGLVELLSGHEPLDLAPFGRVAVEDLPAVLMYDAYVRYEGDQAARKRFLTVASGAAFGAVLADGLSESSLRGAAEAVERGHLAVWSSHPEEQEALVAAGVAGDLGPQRPWARIGLTNADASKLNYWMQPTVELSTPCAPAGARGTSTLSMTLENPVPAEIPKYMRNWNSGPGIGQRTAVTIVSLYVPAGVGLSQARVDGAPVPVAFDTERGWQLVRLTVAVPPDRPLTVTWDLVGPAGLMPREVQAPPTVAEPVVRVEACDEVEGGRE
ncbi:uncharacterized protein DUF4012 [Kineococcus xinjiangensis]|uniref:Uncharacterized protein DUF4012 n=1 Tax=Kineococcus xinjiangensis TaxID=512762 RepID=A0A2S6ISK1_9ACTN|nr:DUF4012 domain-containing protein [Kineococcus xinjiangensis]PPK97234.1 uncharacterized protein DUF4012 [Kineococcus xinjiangensis]